MTDEKYLNIYSAIRDILVIFADSEIGGEYEFNIQLPTTKVAGL